MCSACSRVPDLALRTALIGDRYLLCSDGLSAVVDRGALHAALSLPAAPEQVAEQLRSRVRTRRTRQHRLRRRRRRHGVGQAATAADELSRIAVDSSDSDSIRRRVSDSRVHHG
jgi:hypothetical protein